MSWKRVLVCDGCGRSGAGWFGELPMGWGYKGATGHQCPSCAKEERERWNRHVLGTVDKELAKLIGPSKRHK